MPRVFFSNTSLNFPELGNKEFVDVPQGTVSEIIEFLNNQFPGIKPMLFKEMVNSNFAVRSSSLILKNVVVESGDIFIDKELSKPVHNLNEMVGEAENLLISFFDVDLFLDLFRGGLEPSNDYLSYYNENGETKKLQYRRYILPVNDNTFKKENVRAFVASEIETRELAFDLSEQKIEIRFKTSNHPLDRFDRHHSKVIPSPLLVAIHDLFSDIETDESRISLRLFQEDALFFILGKLWEEKTVPEKALLLSMPTGGGKTEAFVFPIISHLLTRKAEILKSGLSLSPSIKALILYPTKALANDQAKRLAEILQKVNESINSTLPPDLNISIGIFTGDTVTTAQQLIDTQGNFLSLFQVCPKCGNGDFEIKQSSTEGNAIAIQRCKLCGHQLDYVRVTRKDIFSSPPDILITNPDTLNYHIQIPDHQSKLIKDVELIVFDEVHEYNGIFGCNVAHLLRRLENLRDTPPPLYIGVSATIGNAKSLASLLFNIPPESVLYIKNLENRPYLERDKVDRIRNHFLVTPNMYEGRPWLGAYPMTATINLASAIGHAIRDPQFRKLLIFSNFKADHDKLSFQIPENEKDYVDVYVKDIRENLISANKENRLLEIDTPNRSIIRQVSKWFEWENDHINVQRRVLNVGWHRGALEAEERIRAVNRFASLNKIQLGDQIPSYELPTDILVATKTLELGVDIGNVSVVINSSAPFSNNDYVQRIGRGGRRKDSLAITIINPDNAIDAYMREHFSQYVFPSESDFEDAPIIASNELILDSHILAGVLDYLAKSLATGSSITLADLLDHGLDLSGHVVYIDKQPDLYARALQEKIFPSARQAKYNEWFETEANLLGNAEYHNVLETYRLTESKVYDVLLQFCEKIREKVSPGAPNPWDRSMLLTGFDPAIAELRPSLRGSGKSVGLYLKKSKGDDEWKDEISRDRAIYQNPPGSHQSQGRNLFSIERIRNFDQDTEDGIKDTLAETRQAYEYFSRMFPTSSLQNDKPWRWRVQTPKDLLMRHYPGRYHCSNPDCGITYTSGEVTDNLRCLECNWTLNQVTRIYKCRQCNEITEPPVPKICINPDCVRKKIETTRSKNKRNFLIAFKKAIHDKSPIPLRGFFRFRSRPNLEWECMDCHSIISFHRKDATARLGTPTGQLPYNGNLSEEHAHEVIAWYALYRPEAPIYSKKEYLKSGFFLNGYNCKNDNCPAGWSGGLSPVNLPRYQTDVAQYHIADRKISESRSTLLGEVFFFRGEVVSMAERYALTTFHDSDENDEEQGVENTRHRIFEEGELYATKFSPHMFGIRIREKVDKFLNSEFCKVTNCAECQEIVEIELGEHYRPRMGLRHEDIDDGTPVQPDPRAVWCDVNREGKCPSINCKGCEFFNFNALRRFAVLHTLKHGILWALPKYTGLDIGSFKGIVNPGFHSKDSSVPNNLDLIIIDMNDGGSGAIHLVNRWWESHIEPMALEILELASLSKSDPRRANINLPYTCSWFNGNLCPVLTGKFVKSLRT